MALGRLSVAVLCSTLAASMGIMWAAPAGAAPSTTLVYSTDGGATWQTNPTVASGAQLLVRAFYNNDGTEPIPSTQVATSLPAGFTLVAGSTRVCLNPGTTDPTSPTGELACNTDSGQSGAIDESSVWSGGNLTISPTAGLFGQPVGDTSGILATGKKRFLNLDDCDYASSVNKDNFESFVPLPGHTPFSAGTNVSNSTTALSCGPGDASYVPIAQNENVQSFNLLGQRWFNLEQCDYHQGAAHQNNYDTVINAPAGFGSGTNASNTQVNPTNTDATAPTCGPGTAAIPPAPTGAGVLSLDMLNNRYLNLQVCSYFNSTSRDSYQNMVHVPSLSPAFDAGTEAADIPATSSDCGPGGANYALQTAGNSAFLALDTLDQNRGQGFVEFAMTAPTVTSTTVEPQTSNLTGNGTGDPTDTDQITITASVGAPLLDPGVAAIALAVVAAIGFGFWYRRRRTA